MEEGSKHSDDSDYEPAPIACTMNDSQPPPLPPPRSFNYPHGSFTFPRRVHSHSSADIQKSQNQLSLFQAMRQSLSVDAKFLLPKEPVQLSQFITRYSALLPCQVQLCNEFTSMVSAPLQSNILQLHFIKHSKVVVMKEKENGEKCSVPLNSATKFGLVYNPNADLLEAMAGFEFETAGDVMAMKPLPLVLKATQCYKGSSPESSVEEEEILWVLGIRTHFRSKQLRVRSLQKGKKHLSEKCSGAFTTLPDDVQVPLVTLLDLGLQLPQAAVAFGNDSTMKQQSMKHPVILEKMAGETCIIASYPNPEEKEELSHLEVSSDLEVEVEMVAMEPSARKELEIQTQELFVRFNESKPSLIVQKCSKQVYELQTLLHSQLLPGREQEGVQLVHPPMLGIDQQPCEDPLRSEASSSHPPTPEVNILSPSPSSELPPTLENDYQVVPSDEGTADEDYVYMAQLGSIPESPSNDTLNSRSRSQSIESPKRQNHTVANDESQSQMVPTSSNVANLSSKLDNLSQQIGSLSAYMKQQDCILKELEKLQSTMLAVQRDVELLKSSISTTVEKKTSPDPQEEEYERNRRFLATLDNQQVSQRDMQCMLLLW